MSLIEWTIRRLTAKSAISGLVFWLCFGPVALYIGSGIWGIAKEVQREWQRFALGFTSAALNREIEADYLEIDLSTGTLRARGLSVGDPTSADGLAFIDGSVLEARVAPLRDAIALASKTPAAIPKQINLSGGSISIRRDADGAWNFRAGIKPGPPRVIEGLNLPLVFEGCNVVYDDAVVKRALRSDAPIEATNARGFLFFGESRGHLYVTAARPSGGELSVWCWFDYLKPHYAVRVSGIREDAAIARSLAGQIDLEELGGKVDFDLEVSKTSEEKPLFFECTAHLTDGSLRQPLVNTRLTSIEWQGRFDLAGASGSGSAFLAGSPVAFSFDVRDYSAPRVEARVRSDRFRLAAAEALLGRPSLESLARRKGLQLDLPDSAKADATVLWSQDTGIAAYGWAALDKIGMGGEEVRNLKCEFEYASDSAAISIKDVQIAGGRLSATGIVDMRPQGANASLLGCISDADLALLSDLAGTLAPSGQEWGDLDVRGRCDAVVSAQYADGALTAASTAEVSGAAVSGYEIERARIDARYDGPGGVAANGFVEDPSGAVLWADGTFSPERELDFQLSLAGFDLSNLSSLGITEEVSGSLWMTGHLRGPLDAPVLSADCAAFDVAARGFSVSAVRGQVDAARGAIDIAQMHAFAGGGEVLLSGELLGLGTQEGFTVDIEGSADHIALGGLGIDVLDEVGATGVLSADFAARGDPLDPTISLQAAVANGTIYSYPFGDLDVVASYSDGLIALERLSAEFLSQRIDASGMVRPGETMSIAVDVADLRADALAALLEPLAGLGGKFDAHAEISGPIDSPSARVSFASTALAFAGEPLGAAIGTISVESGAVSGRDFISQLGDQMVQIDRVFHDGATANTEFSARAENFRLATLVRMARSGQARSVFPEAIVKAARKLRGDPEGIFSASADLRTGVEGLSGSVEASGEKLAFDGKAIGDLDVKVELTEGSIEIQSCELAGKHGIVALRGAVSREGTAQLSVAGGGISLPYIGEWLPRGLPINGGEASFECRIGGPAEDRVLQGSFSISGLDVPLIPVRSVECSDVSASGGRLFVKGMTASTQTTEVIVSADLPLDISEFSMPADEPISLTAALRKKSGGSDRGEAGTLSGLVGELEGDLRLTGTLETPEVEGELTVEGATLSLPYMTRPAELVNLRASVTTDRIELTALEANLGRGKLSAEGAIELDGLSPTAMRFRAGLDRAGIGVENVSDWYKERFDGELTGELTVTNVLADGTLAPLREPNVSGNVAVSNAIVSIPRPPSQERPARPVPSVNPSFDIRVQSANPVAVRVPSARVDADADFWVRGSLQSPQVTGTVVATRGQMHFAGTRFRLKSGEVQLTYSAPVLVAFLSASAETRTPDARIMIDISGAWGPFSNLSVDLSSSPPMPESEILTVLGHGADIERMLSGRTMDAFLSDETWKLLASAFQPRLLMPFEDVLIEALGLESVSIDLGFAGQSYVSLEKQIFRGLFLGYTKALTGVEARETLRLFWRINRYSELYWSQDPEWGQRMGVTARWRF